MSRANEQAARAIDAVERCSFHLTADELHRVEGIAERTSSWRWAATVARTLAARRLRAQGMSARVFLDEVDR
jgi:hypothetical protein